MKKLLTILFLVLAISSCNEQTFTKSNLPIEVVSLKEANKFDTILQIETDKEIYQFKNNQEYIGKTNKIQEDFFPLGLIIGILITVVVIMMIA